jgi:putative acetyltransferase
MLVVRREIDSDRAAIRYLLEQAFGSQVEATLVEALRHRRVLILSLVATDRDRLVGHIAFSPVTIEPEGASLNAVGLAPLAVLPEYQQQGIGSQLVEIGLEECQKADFDAVFVYSFALNNL